MTFIRKSLLATVLFLVILVVGAYWLIGTDSGTRWLLGRTAGFLPEELRLGETRGSLLHGVSVASLEWQDEANRLQAVSLYVDIQLWPLLGRHLIIDELDAGRIELSITDNGEPAGTTGLPNVELPIDLSIAYASIRQILISSGGFSRSIDEIRLTGNLRGSDLQISQLALRSDWLDLDVSGQLTLADSYPGRIGANWRWKESEPGPFAGELRITGDARAYDLEHLLNAPLTIRSSGTVSYAPGSVSADLLHEWQALEWPLGQQTLYSPDGKLRISGNADAFSLDLEALARIDDQPDTAIKLTGEADLEAMRVSHLAVENLLGRIEASGDVRWLPGRSFDLQYSATGLDPSFLLDSVAGRVGLEGTVTGSVGDNGPDIDLRVERLEGEVNQNPVRGSGVIGISGPGYSVSDTRLQVGSNSVRIDGVFGKSLSLRAEIDAADIAEVLPDATGSLRGRISVRGPSDYPDVQFNLSGAALAWREYSLDSLSANADISAIKQGTAEVQLGRLTIGTFELDEAQLSVTGQLAAHNLRASLRALDTNLVVAASGGYDQQAWSGQLASLAVDNEVLDRWSTLDPSQLTASSDRVSLSRTCLFGPQDTSEVCLSGNVLADGPAAFDISVSGVPVSAIPALPPEGVTLRGHLFADVNGEWVSDRLSARSNVEWRDAAIDAVYDEELVSLVVTKAVGEMTVIDNRVTSAVHVELADRAASGNVQLSIQDFTNNQSAISGRADVSISDASLAAVAVPGILNPQGKVDGTLTLSGSLDSPDFVGEIALTDGSFGLRQTGIEVSELDLRLAQLAPGQLRLHGSARSGEGRVSIEGQTQIGAGSGIRSELQITGEDFELARLPDWQIAASPSIAVVFDDRAARISGDLAIPSASIRVREIPESAESPSPDAIVHRPDSAPPAPARRIDVDVRTTLGDDVQFAGFGLTTGLQGAVQIRGGSHAAYTGNGRLALREGRYKAYGQELEIERGELIFNGPLDNPQLDVRAIRRIRDVVAGIELSGTPAELRSSVYSEPAMSDAEVLSYLLTGRPLASATSSGEGNALNNAAFALGLSGAGSITSQIRGQLGLETLTIAGGADDSRLIAGKRFGDRLLVEYGYGLVDKLGTLLLRYQLNDRFMLESRTGTVSNLDIVYSVKKK